MIYQGFAFWIQRPQDTKAWPAIFEDEARARAYPHRVSEVAVVNAVDLASAETDVKRMPPREFDIESHQGLYAEPKEKS